MNATLPNPVPWSSRKLWAYISLATIAQVLLAYWLSAKTPRPRLAADARPLVQLVASPHNELLAVMDPTLFSLAHPEGFSGSAWIRFKAHPERPPESSVLPQWLALAPESLGASLREFVKTDNVPELVLRKWRTPEPSVPSSKFTPVMNFTSGVRAVGALAERGLINPPPLPAWTNADILGPSKVLVLVDARGNPISAVLEPNGSSGYRPADVWAVDHARTILRFGADEDALRNHPNDPAAGVVSGRVIFEWQTVAPAVNSSVNPR